MHNEHNEVFPKRAFQRFVLIAILIGTTLIVTGTSWHSAIAQGDDGNGGEQEARGYDQLEAGKINDANPEDVWHFNSRAKGDHISVTVDRMSDNLVPAVELQDDNGKLLARADHDKSFARAFIPEFTLPEMGEYRVVVDRYNGKNGKSQGQYQMVVGILGSGEGFVAPALVLGEVKADQPRKGSLANMKWQDSWAFRTDTIESVTITVTRTNGTLVPNVMLWDAEHQELVSAQADETFATATIRDFMLPHPGTYYVVVFREGRTAGGTVGEYEVLVKPNPVKTISYRFR